MTLQRRTTDVLVVGAGQAGLAVGRALVAAGVDCQLQERAPRVGDAWRRRFDSLVLFTPRELSSLPELALSGDPNGYPRKDELGDYLERYAARLALPVRTGDGIARVSLRGGRFLAVTESHDEIDAAAVVVATGAFQRPRVPRFAAELASSVRQLDAATYRNAASVAGRRVAVIGDGATGRQIALELTAAGLDVTLAMGRRRNFGPQRVLGKDATRWALDLGLITADKDSWRGRLARRLDMMPGLHLRARALERAGLRLAPRCVSADGTQLRFSDGSSRECDTVIFALGYRDDTEWLSIDGAACDGRFAETRGVSPVPGLFYIGREWQTCRASALVCGVHRDAAVIASQVKRHLSSL